MLKELIKLANHLDSKGLTREADYIDRLIKKAGEFEDYMAKEMGHEYESTLSPTEEPDITKPSLGGEECEEFTNACLGLVRVLDFYNLDKFYYAAIKFVNAIKNITNNDKLNYVVTPNREDVVSQFGFLTQALNYRLQDGETEEHYYKRKELRGDPLIKAIDMAITALASSTLSSGFSLSTISAFSKEFLEQTGISKSCVKSVLLRILKESDNPELLVKIRTEQIEREFS